ncbi:MAG TPA: 2-hydroxychromene-2-carboxylate isomerase [Candidatus Limnocylindria bacterium]|nr:2-hydroxychromene-2-carboxylate isomerase [Candidatus Limnocylindria bacterium]
MKPVRFYFDFLSPYAYLAWTQVHTLAERYGREVEAVPILFAALLGAHGTKGPAEIPAKRVYVWKDVLRTARVLGVPLSTPPAHPFNPLLALRVASADLTRGERRRLVDALYAATWGGGPGVTDPEVVARIASDAGFDGPALVRAAGTPALKARLKAQTDEALAHGAFGVPSLLVDGELFWGFDSFGHVERRLAGKDPLGDTDILRWKDLPVGATRRTS